MVKCHFKILQFTKSLLWLSLLSIQVLSYGSYTILVHLCEENGHISFHSTVMNLTIEFFKLFFSLACYYFHFFIDKIYTNRRKNSFQLAQYDNFNNDRRKSLFADKKILINIQSENILHKTSSLYGIKFSFNDSLHFSIPAFLYFINNNLAVYIQLYMDSTSYQMMSNLKIFTTAILYYFIMGKSLTRTKWFSLSLLFFAGIFYTYANLKSLSNYYVDETDLEFLIIRNDLAQKSSNNDLVDTIEVSTSKTKPGQVKYRLRNEIFITEIGFLMMIIYCLISGLSGVYNEYLLKANYKDSIYLQNIYLYIYGCLFNFIACIIEMHNSDNFLSNKNKNNFSFMNIFTGFNIYTWTIIVTQVFNGFLMSVVMKYSNNITRLFVISSSLVVTSFLSVLIFSIKLNIFFYLSFSAIMFGLYFYII